MTTKKQFDVDIIIVGAGLVGTTVITGLRNKGFRIAVLEKHLPTIVNAEKEDPRPLSLAMGSQRCLERWGVWSSLASSSMPIETLHISEQGRLGRVEFLASEFNLPALAYVVPFSLLQQTLYDCASSQADVTFTSIEKILSIVCDDQGARVEYSAMNQTHYLSANLLIAADGTHSLCRQLLNISAEETKTDEVALVATLQCDQMHQGKAYQRFTHQGSFALLPLFNKHQYRLVWTMKKHFYERVVDWTDEVLLKTVKQAYGGRLETLTHVQRNEIFPLSMSVTKKIIQPSVVLLGNAAHTIYPVAAQGFNLGLQDAAALASVLSRAKQQGESIGALSTLERYVECRTDNQQAVIRWTNLAANVFYWRIPVIDHVRGLGMLGLDSVCFLKNYFARNFLHVG